MTETTTSSGGKLLEAAQHYRDYGFALVPTKGKDAFVREWESRGTPPKDDTKYWANGHAHNLGLVLGAASGGLVDIDRDCDLPERVEGMFLPPTLMSGRVKRPHTHSWYFCPGIKSRALYDAGGKKFLEVRSDGHQTVVWPSVHPEGDKYLWHGKLKEIVTADRETLAQGVNEYATALLLAVHMPPVGSRHDYALSAAGFMLRDGRLDADTVYRIFLGAWKAQRADTPKTVKELESAVFDTAEKLANGEGVKGGGALGELVGGLPKRISRIWSWGWADYSAKNQASNEVGITKRLADAILEDNHFAQDAGGKLYRYSGGVYKKAAEKYIKRRVKELLEEWGDTKKWSSYRASEVTEYIRADADELWDKPPTDEINVLNGIVNVYTLERRDHSPVHLSSVQLPIRFDPEALCPAWDRYVVPSFPDDAPDLPFEIAASIIAPYRAIQKAVLLSGEGDNGKSTYLAALTRLVGSANVTGLSLQRLESNQFAAARLVGKLANICPDLPSSHLNDTSIFKALTGDEAQITAEYKHKDSFEFEPFVKLIFSANHPPRSADASHAFFRRWLVAPFERTFSEEEKIPREELDTMLSTPEELSGVLNRALAVIGRVRARGFTESKKMKEAWQEFRETTDPVSVWLTRYTTEHADAYVPRSKLLELYNHHCEDQGRGGMTHKAFTQALKRHKPNLEDRQVTIGGKRVWCWIGLGLKEQDPDPPPPQGAQSAQHAQGSPNCEEKAVNSEAGAEEKGEDLTSRNIEEPVHPVHGVHDGSSLAAYFASPPEWLSTQLDRCRQEPERFINPTSASIANEVYGTASRWQEVRPFVERYLEEGGA